MKKLLLSLILSVCALSASAQSVQEIMDRYVEETGLANFDLSDPDMSVRMVMKFSVAGQEIPMDAIIQGTEKFRIEMSAMGQDMLMVRNGDNGWMKMGAMVQALPAEALNQQAQQTNLLSGLQFDLSQFDSKYLGEEDGMQKIELVKKADKTKAVLFMDKATGLISKMEATLEENAGPAAGKTVTTTLSDYEDFDGMKVPTVWAVNIEGMPEGNTSIVVAELELDYPVAAWMFAEPTAE